MSGKKKLGKPYSSDYNKEMAVNTYIQLVHIKVNEIAEAEKFFDIVFDILGLEIEEKQSSEDGVVDELMKLVLDFRLAAKTQKDYATADQIRDRLRDLNITVKDGKDGAEWSFEK